VIEEDEEEGGKKRTLLCRPSVRSLSFIGQIEEEMTRITRADDLSPALVSVGLYREREGRRQRD
jgi:hypothetical protein